MTDWIKYISIILVVIVPWHFSYDGPYNGLQKPTCPISFHTTNINRNFWHRSAIWRERFQCSLTDVAMYHEYRATLYRVLFKLWLDIWSS